MNTLNLGNEAEIQVDWETNEDSESLSDLSIENFKLEKMGQYTCDECSEIPTIISTDINKKAILYKCIRHGKKEKNIKEYLANSINYNANNWKCSQCETIQRNSNQIFIYCQCLLVFCEYCFRVHVEIERHKYSIDSNHYDLRCKKEVDHFGEYLKGYCNDCHEHYCYKCEEDHISKFHTTTELNRILLDNNELII